MFLQSCSALIGQRSPRFGGVVAELLARALHCCHGDTWHARQGGLDAAFLVLRSAPPALALQSIPQVIRATASVLRSIPDPCTGPQHDVAARLLEFIGACFRAKDKVCGGERGGGTRLCLKRPIFLEGR